ncbi:hypothetical protein M9H77_17280 [Catharanthus roseus]|uniref:Uncharacterized protein n=1 Tax=Catharanthus roseus TaxID=4058 RepID=A0ACC0B454_CATRO|nr:hypothetical protein M9H77_17280 [Catharanthus roseus]
MEKTLKNKFGEFGDQGKASKLFPIWAISKDHSRKQLEGENWLSVGEGHPTADGSLAPTIAGRLLPTNSLKFIHLPPMFLIKGLIGFKTYISTWKMNSIMWNECNRP